jgi:hypothetical protein
MELKNKIISEELKIIKVIPKYKITKILFYESSSIENIYFDTYGQYPFLKEAPHTSDYNVEFK